MYELGDIDGWREGYVWRRREVDREVRYSGEREKDSEREGGIEEERMDRWKARRKGKGKRIGEE